MQVEKTIRALEDFGLSEKEAMTYLASLSLGSAVVQSIAMRAKLTRPTTYLMVDSLLKRGLMVEERRGKKRFLRAVGPQRLVRMVDKEKFELERQEKATMAVIKSVGKLPNDDGDIDLKITDRETAACLMRESCHQTERPVCVAYNQARAHEAVIVTEDDEVGAALATRHLLKTVVQETPLARLSAATKVRLALANREIGAALVIVDDEIFFSGAADSDKCLYIRNVAIATTLRTMFDAFYDESRQS
jgi:sugar-specific transcriptional regulator TrmB